jgi:stage II sporulation protein AB (anti-sigma F factor)
MEHRDFAFSGEVASVSAARDQILDFVREYCWNESDEIDLLVALQEALANAALHGCGDDASKQIHCSVEADLEKIRVVIRDPGPGFDVERLANPKYFDTSTAEHGRGIALMRGLVDELEFHHGGSELRLCKRLNP